MIENCYLILKVDTLQTNPSKNYVLGLVDSLECYFLHRCAQISVYYTSCS